MLILHNSLTRKKQIFTPITPGQVRMYVCGMTVYDYCHLGHARVLVVFDMVARWLKASGLSVTYVRNITDIDDKIIARAHENNESIATLTNRFVAAMNEDAAALGVLPPTHEPRATDFVEKMVAMIKTLVDKGLAYPAANGDVYYAVHQFAGYGKLSGKTLDDLRAGERVEVDPHKRDPLDFVLWKAAKPGEPAWDSPWGKGRPGWHIECSAMSEQLLGEHFDIHGGGQDLQFPHHENEIAQSEGAHAHPFVNYWLHNGFVRIDNEKMSKSLGNFFTVRDILKKYDAEVVRFFILRAHYRSPLNYADAHLDDAKQGLARLYTALRGIQIPHYPPFANGEAQIPLRPLASSSPFAKGGAEKNVNNVETPPFAKGGPGGIYAEEEIAASASSWTARFQTAMNDDFNTPVAFAVLFDLANQLNKTKLPDDAALLKSLGGVLGLLQQDPEKYLQSTLAAVAAKNAEGGGYADGHIEQLIAERRAARAAKNFAESDRIRATLLQAGIVLEDTAQGTSWRRG